MEKIANRAKQIALSVCALLILVVSVFTLAACGNNDIYNVDFSGNKDGEAYNVAATTWTKSSEKGFDAVYTLTGTVAYDKATADALGYTDGRVHFALIRFTSDSVERVSYNSEEDTGFRCIVNKGTDGEKVKHGSFTSGDSATQKNTYFFYQGIGEETQTFTLHISFDGTEANERAYKFVIDHEKFTLADAPAESA